MLDLRRIGSLALLLAAGCGGKPDPVSADFQSLPADQVIVDVTHTPTVNGVRSAVGRYDTVLVHDDSASYELRGVDLTMYDSSGKETAHLTSQTGELNTETNAMVARGNVVLITAEGRRIETEELHYDPASHRVWSDVATTQTFKGDRVTGDSFTADDAFRNVTIRNARGRFPGVKLKF